jgi:hypothetical protein
MLGLALVLALFVQDPAVRPGTISGALRTVDGAPAVATRVSVIPAPNETSRPSFGSQYFYRQPAVATALSDNQGRYRLTNIPPGRYLLVSGITYYPTTLDADAARILIVTPGFSADNMDFQLMRPLGGKVTGKVTPRPESVAGQTAILSGPDLDEILEVPVAADGGFEFGHVPTGIYLIDMVPPFPGLGSFRVQVSEKDITGLQIVRPPTHTVSGKIVVQNGPLPRAILDFSTQISYVGATIKPDLTFSARLHSAKHKIELAGLPGGYSIVSVRAGSADATEGLTVGNADLSNVVVTVAAPRVLPKVRGRLSGLSPDRLGSTHVELSGPIVGVLDTAVKPDGSFEFAAATPGDYRLRLPQVPELAPIYLVVTWSDAQVDVTVPGR